MKKAKGKKVAAGDVNLKMELWVAGDEVMGRMVCVSAKLLSSNSWNGKEPFGLRIRKTEGPHMVMMSDCFSIPASPDGRSFRFDLCRFPNHEAAMAYADKLKRTVEWLNLPERVREAVPERRSGASIRIM